MKRDDPLRDLRANIRQVALVFGREDRDILQREYRDAGEPFGKIEEAAALCFHFDTWPTVN
jgi:hypothetical protein